MKFARLAALWLILMVISSCAMADGGGSWLSSKARSSVQLASLTGKYNGYVDISGKGGITVTEQTSVRVISRNASVWAEARTNSKKLGSVSNGEELSGVLANNSGAILERDGFYAVNYKGQTGWINQSYVVCGPFEIVLMESNVPAYSAPDSRSKKVGSLSKLTRYTVVGLYNDYYVINLREGSAFIPMSARLYDTAFERNYHACAHYSLTVNNATSLRTGPGNDYAEVRKLNKGETFDCVDNIDGWYLVTDGDKGGYTYIWSGDAQCSL